MAVGDGRNSGLIQPALPANCHSPITSTSAIQPAWRPAFGLNPPPRNATGCVSDSAFGNSERSSMLDLALGFHSLFADQRPQFALQRQQLAAGIDVAALKAGQGNGDDLAARPGPRQH